VAIRNPRLEQSGSAALLASCLDQTRDYSRKTLAAEDKIIADLFVHRSKRKKERQTLKQLLDRYGRMQCTEPRDRVFFSFFTRF
jgi:hypothetical protein